MIEAIIEYSIKNRFIVIAVFLGVIAWGVHSVVHTPVDAIPDLSENQVIVFTDWMGRSPREIEDQVTYPLSVNLQGLAGVKAVRATSEFNFSMINVIFEDKVDFYFARQRVLERLTLANMFLPPGVVPYLAPDATALGQIFWYTVEGIGLDPGRLRAIQDFYVRYQLNSVPGVAQVASVGGYPIEVQIDVDPLKLRAFGVSLGELYTAVARSNSAVGGRVILKGTAEYLVRGVGWIESAADIEAIVVRTDPERGTPITVAELATVSLGPQFRRSVLEKDGNEVTGGVVMMRHGENPLDVTRRVKEKIERLQPGLPEGVRIVPFYDRTRLIEGAIATLTEVLAHEMVIASVAILLILGHARSAFVICLTLPLAVLVSFILMRYVGVASNIMSLAGIAISIGILVDQAIVMVENATHHLSAHFGRERVTGDTREIVIPACRMVGRPIFFSVLIILISFIPVFALSGQEGKTFHPLAFTKSFAMLGVALISITLVPALIPTFVRGRLKSEQESWIVRTLIDIYRPLLSWSLDYPKVVNWLFVVLLGIGWHLSSKVGREYMPPLDEGSILDMPITVPRASIIEVADDLKARDAIIRTFPEVEMVVGKAGRADTPTDPAPLDMVETVINLRPKAEWTKRCLHYEDALAMAVVALTALEREALLTRLPSDVDRKGLIERATMQAIESFDHTMRTFAHDRLREIEADLESLLARDLVLEIVDRWRTAQRLLREVTTDEVERTAGTLVSRWGARLATGPAAEDVTAMLGAIAEALAREGAVHKDPGLFIVHRDAAREVLVEVGELLGIERRTLSHELWRFVHKRRAERFSERMKTLDRDVFDVAAGVFDWSVMEALVGPHPGLRPPLSMEWRGAGGEVEKLHALRSDVDSVFRTRVFLWKTSKDDLVRELDGALQVPGWGNIWTQPIINRIDMLATGVRTMIGVKVFGRDLDEIQHVSEEVAKVLREVRGAVDVFPDQNVGKGYLEITIDRKKAARYGLAVADIQDVIEVALGGRVLTTTVEGRERHPVRVRYARAFREDEEAVKNLLVSVAGAAGGMSGGMTAVIPGSPSGPEMPTTSGSPSRGAMPETGRGPRRPMQVPLAAVADVRIVEGPAMIKSENGLLRSYVQLNVRDRDIIGFVEEAQRAVEQRVTLPAGMVLEWSGQFEHQVRARRTLQIVFPAVILLIFLILYVTYHDLLDALLMMMAVPEALVGGIVFLYLFDIKWSVAVWVGFIACFGMATETGIIMLVYLREAIERRGGLAGIASLDELRQAVLEGAVHRLRPKLLTEGVAIVALAPMLWATGVGHEVISAMAAPVLGGLLVSDEVVDIFIPVRFYAIRRARWLKLHGKKEAVPS